MKVRAMIELNKVKITVFANDVGTCRTKKIATYKPVTYIFFSEEWI